MKFHKLSIVVLFLIKYQIKGHGVEEKKIRCGKRLVNHKGLIIDGHESKPGDWPWHAAIYHYKNLDAKYKCGGTIINSNSILTASHCVHENERPITPERVLVQVGKHNLRLPGTNTQSFEVHKIICHPKYDTSSLINDIAIIRLATEATFNYYVQPICLWDSRDTDVSEVIGKLGTVIGWGITENNQLSYILRQAVIPVVSLTTCLDSNRDFFGSFLSNNNFCAGFQNGTGACVGDSGGSLTFQENGVYRIRGIVSLTVARKDLTRYCESKDYVLFTDVAKYLPWIEEWAPQLPSAMSGFRVGCFRDKPQRQLNALYGNLHESNNPDVCVASCGNAGFKYAATENGHECYCGNILPPEKIVDTDCNVKCLGAPHLFCGGVWALEVYDTNVEMQGTVRIGCFRDKNERQLNEAYWNLNESNNPAACITLCTYAGFKYAATENGHECFCGNTLPPEKIANTDCNVKCRGAPQLLCGGVWALEVYETNVDSYKRQEIVHVGCFRDKNERQMNEAYWNFYDFNNPATCIASCRYARFKYAATQNGHECYCGNTLPPEKIANTDCNVKCRGAPQFTCGGVWALEAYKTN